MPRKSSSSSRKERRAASRRDAEVVAAMRHNIYQTGNMENPDFDFAHLRYHCAECGEEGGGRIFACSKCNAIKYCGKKCQTAAWKRVHRRICGDEASGFPTISKLQSASFYYLTLVLDEWGTCCESISGHIATILAEKPSLVQEADPLDVSHMAQSISRLLDKAEAATLRIVGVAFLACRLLDSSDSERCGAMSSTPLFSSTIGCFLAEQKFSNLLEIKDQNDAYRTMFSRGNVAAALSLQLKKMPMGDYSLFHTDLLRCANATMQALATYNDFRDMRSDVHATGEKQNVYVRHLFANTTDDCTILNMHMHTRELASNLAIRGFAPSMVDDVKSIFEADMMYSHLESEDFHETVALWASIAGNLNKKCNANAKGIVKAVYKVVRAHFGNDKYLLNLLDK